MKKPTLLAYTIQSGTGALTESVSAVLTVARVWRCPGQKVPVGGLTAAPPWLLFRISEIA